MKLTQYGSNSILIQLKEVIDPEVNETVSWLNSKLEMMPEIVYTIPAYNSVTAVFNPGKISFDVLKNRIKSWESKEKKNTISSKEQRSFRIPVCYEEKFAPDMEEVCSYTSLTSEQIISLHTSTPFKVYMIGFIPGFPYLGKLPDQLRCKRKENPRKQVPQGAVGLAGSQTGIYPAQAPGGWQLIGNSPVPPLNLAEQNPFLFRMGDTVRFYPISASEHSTIATGFSKGQITEKEFYE
ncbi:hypothetical protein GCM10011506_32790 [Marivirga lumbricoides]|uniref:Carboxyltransferase domain-containing protein n=1 Tax=Marivirga lumbricoides TaxID=1046115 RepID=A0ABQ1MPU2_9BACT|nr:hypothetical protein GCM10011506_32790 [Marivirga lumbricoides]